VVATAWSDPGWSEDRSNDKRATAPETAYGCTGGRKLRRENPMSGSGMKYGRQVWGGARRHEVEKTCRRMPIERGKPDHFCAAASGGETLKGRKPHGRMPPNSANGFGRARESDGSSVSGALCRRVEARERRSSHTFGFGWMADRVNTL
jgi:hypothetical protein